VSAHPAISISGVAEFRIRWLVVSGQNAALFDRAKAGVRRANSDPVVR
jgi:hypothetical protein